MNDATGGAKRPHLLPTYMKTATIRLKLDEHKNDVPKLLVTPPEAQLLACLFNKKVQGSAVTVVEETADVERSPAFELARLSHKYPRKVVNALFGSANPRFPASFEEALASVTQAVPDSETLTGREAVTST